MALYPPSSCGSWASWLHTSATCSFTSLKKPFSVSCRGDEDGGGEASEPTRPW